jgi:hypothetical protein
MNVIQESKSRKTYATFDNAVTAIEKAGLMERRWLISITKEGRYFPVFIGTENIGVVHLGFTVVG